MSVMAEYATEQARIWRLRTELGEQGSICRKQSADPAELGERLMQVETEHLKARLADRERDKALLRDAITKASLQLNTLPIRRKG